MTLSEFKSEDYLGLKWHFFLLVICVAIVISVFFALNKYDQNANRQLNIVRSDMSSAQTALDQIEQEKTTITEYIGRYQELKKDGIVSEKDRIHLLEIVAQIRARYSLFPVNMNTEGLDPYILPYDTSVYQAGEPVKLEMSPISITLPLLHEGDLVNFLDSLLVGPEMILPTSCKLTNNSLDKRDFLRLGQHLNATCSMLWYSFTVMGKNGEPL